MNAAIRTVFLLSFLSFNFAIGAPDRPSKPDHPGSKVYSHGFELRSLKCSGRDVNVFLPTSADSSESYPVVVYGHGQALSLKHYQATFEHIAKKGVAVVFPMYDNGFFDQDWYRMARDFVSLTNCAIQNAGPKLNSNWVIFSGHSKGAYVASIASGLAYREKLSILPQAQVLFELAGFDRDSAASIDPQVATTIIFGDADTTVNRGFSDSLFDSINVQNKQFILVKTYPADGQSKAVVADHFWPQTLGTFLGGGPESPLHYFGAWKWLVGAALDLRDGNTRTNPYVYGQDTADKGQAGFTDELKRNW